MIFVTVGTARDFSRLIKKVDEIAKEIKEEVIIQRGNTRYKPKNCKYFDFIPRDEFLNHIKKADVVITHGGVGSIIDSLKYGKPTIVVPRRKMFNEHRNDHQVDITKELERESRILACYDVDNLKEIIDKSMVFKPTKKSVEKDKIKEVLYEFIESSKIHKN
jgi:UDP-N-acetylglucosamine transferase subunit ALG13